MVSKKPVLLPHTEVQLPVYCMYCVCGLKRCFWLGLLRELFVIEYCSWSNGIWDLTLVAIKCVKKRRINPLEFCLIPFYRAAGKVSNCDPRSRPFSVIHAVQKSTVLCLFLRLRC